VTALVACAHGTRSPEGRAAVASLVSAVRATSDVPVLDAFVDVHGPYVDDVVSSVAGDAVVVPLLLAPGYHVRVDIARAVGPWSAPVAPALGPSRLLTSLLMDRLCAVGARPGDAVVLGGAGSSDDASDVSVRAVARSLSVAWGAPVTVAYGASRTPSLPDEVARLRRLTSGRVVVASYLLATGHFHRRILAAGADLVTAPLLDGGEPDVRLVKLVRKRFDDGVLARDRRLRSVSR
jgi:sirohydrochlorin ferrochelatase